MRRYLVLLLAVCMIFTFAACGADDQSTDDGNAQDQVEQIADDDQAGDQNDDQQDKSDSDPAYESLDMARNQIKTADAAMGVIYIGYIAGQTDRVEAVANAADKSYLSAIYPFIKEIPKEEYIEFAGDEVYCIIPQSVNCAVKVNECYVDENNDYKLTAGEERYACEYGDPVIVIGNISDIMSNMMVTVYCEGGRTVQYAPYLSLENGEVGVTDGVVNLTP